MAEGSPWYFVENLDCYDRNRPMVARSVLRENHQQFTAAQRRYVQLGELFAPAKSNVWLSNDTATGSDTR